MFENCKTQINWSNKVIKRDKNYLKTISNYRNRTYVGKSWVPWECQASKRILSTPPNELSTINLTLAPKTLHWFLVVVQGTIWGKIRALNLHSNKVSLWIGVQYIFIRKTITMQDWYINPLRVYNLIYYNGKKAFTTYQLI